MLETGDGEITTFIVTAKENPQFTVMHRRLDTVAGANKTPLMKYHKRDYEAYYVVCGKIRFLAGNENEYTAEATSGTLVVIPPYCSRGYVCLADNTVCRVPTLDQRHVWNTREGWNSPAKYFPTAIGLP